jgi:hypothetical protein
MRKTRRCKSEGGGFYRSGGNDSAMEIADGKSAGVRKGNVGMTPASRITRGYSEAVRPGMNSKELGMGMPAGRVRYNTGGHAIDMNFEPKGERLRKSRKRNDILGMPHYADGGQIQKGMRALYNALHSHFENQPQMKKLRVTKEDVYEGIPHRYKRASGGRLWIQDAINPSKKGALHKSLGVPKGKKIPIDKIHKAEHSKSPLLRKRARLADTLRGFHT